jgi:hypothetical protein
MLTSAQSRNPYLGNRSWKQVSRPLSPSSTARTASILRRIHPPEKTAAVERRQNLRLKIPGNSSPPPSHRIPHHSAIGAGQQITLSFAEESLKRF